MKSFNIIFSKLKSKRNLKIVKKNQSIDETLLRNKEEHLKLRIVKTLLINI